MKIYISSTFEDLKEEREAVYRLLSKISGREVHAMEDYIASDTRPLERCTGNVSECDVYVGIVAWRYGYIPEQDNPQQRSITELEYLCAHEAGKPCLIFMLNEDASWQRSKMDECDRDGDGGERINALRERLGTHHTVSFFSSPDELAGLVSAAVTDWEKKQAPPVEEPSEPPPEAPAQFRELRNCVLLAYGVADAALAQELAEACAPASSKPVLISATALFAADEDGFCRLEEDVIRCDAGLALLTPAVLSQLKDRPQHAQRAIALMRARLGPPNLRALLAGGLTPQQLPGEWGMETLMSVPPDSLAGTDRSALGAWLAQVLPPWGVSAVGLPVSVVAMREDEARALQANPDMVGAELGTRVQDQYVGAAASLAAAGIPWHERYAGARMHWHPFGSSDGSVHEIVESVVEDINRRALPKLRTRHIKVQWYPFDVVMDQHAGGDQSLRTVYEGVARAGCVLVVDEMSMFHPGVRQALMNSPMFNNEQVALVTVSPLDPDDLPLNQCLENEARRKLAGAFTRFAMDYDPQCELAVGNERHLKRWLHLSLPETVIHLREPRPDARAMNAFFEQDGVPARSATRGYPWGGGEHP